MKTRKELEKRYEELVLEMQKWNKMFEAYGGTETKVNDWEGITEEGLKKLKEYTFVHIVD